MDAGIEHKYIIKNAFDTLSDSTMINDCLNKSYEYENFFNNRHKCHFIQYLKSEESKFHNQFIEFTGYIKECLQALKRNRWMQLYCAIYKDSCIKWDIAGNETLLFDKIVYSLQQTGEIQKSMQSFCNYLSAITIEKPIEYELPRGNPFLTLKSAFQPNQTTYHDYSNVNILINSSILFPIAFQSIVIFYEDSSKEIIKCTLNSSDFNGDVLLQPEQPFKCSTKVDINDKDRTKISLKFILLKFNVKNVESLVLKLLPEEPTEVMISPLIKDLEVAINRTSPTYVGEMCKLEIVLKK
jgi:hypothetical protein